MKYANILFDLDGTLTDPYLGISHSVQHALKKLGIEEKDEKRLRFFIGPPLKNSFKEFYHFDDATMETAIHYFREYFEAKGIYENKLYEGAGVLLKTLTGKGKKCILATSKPQKFAEKILRHFDIHDYFYDIVGSNLDETMTEKDEVIRWVMEKNNLEKEKTIMIGDRKYDIDGARKNNIASLAVLYGYGSKEELENSRPDYLCETIQDILAVV